MPATEAVTEGTRNGFTAVRNSEEVQTLLQGTKNFLRRVEDPFLVGLTLFNPPLVLGATGIVKGSRLVGRGLTAEAQVQSDADSTASTSTWHERGPYSRQMLGGPFSHSQGVPRTT